MKLVGHRDTITHEKIITNNPSLHEKKNLTFDEKMKELKADFGELKRALEADIGELKRASEADIRDLKGEKVRTERLERVLETEKVKTERLERVLETEKVKTERLERVLETEKVKTERLERDKMLRYEGETVNMRKRLWEMTRDNTDSTQKIYESTSMKTARKQRSRSAHQTDLDTVMKLADKDPQSYDILLDAIYGASKKDIKLLIDADKTGGNQVYNILNDRGSAFHNHYANTCIKPFNLWLSVVRGLQSIQSNTANKPSSDHESCVRTQKAKVQESIREWDAALEVDKSKRDTNTKTCQREILKDYEDRDLIPYIQKLSVPRGESKAS
ncbi:uncharacterized protein EAE98_010729 [Botrytis deweyae]|uniref:SMC hinge domain-containing protein n=1 Tax=Botrytis deweyae TaxID=2478750 RepID=A0ABQ7I862_9HELO|nr:uncharacterized protein EAE98_010729 [Botrytis deweyae]KAF7916430.1 hypothetical protein EAE98_010729 [Botrytis deweyae]